MDKREFLNTSGGLVAASSTATVVTPSATSSVFVVFFSVNLSSPDHRQVLLRRYVEEGLGPEVQVLDHAVLEPGPCNYCMVLVASAASQSLVEAAIAPCLESYHTTVVKADSVTANPAVIAVNFCLLGWDDPAAQPPLIANRASVLAAVAVKTQVELPKGSPCSCLWLLNAPTALRARDYCAHTREATSIACVDATEPVVFFRQAMNRVPSEARSEPVALPAATGTAAFSVINQDSSPAVCGSLVAGQPYPSLFGSRQSAAPGQSNTFASDVYIWQAMSGVFTYTLMTTVTDGSGPHQVWVPKKLVYNSPYPVLSTGYAPGVSLGYDLSQGGGFRIVSDLLTWLDTLLNTPTFNKPWLEDTYTGNTKLAYQFILSNIDGQMPPNQGSVKPGIIEAIVFEENHGFSQAEFDVVKSHLIDECTYFEYSSDWFGSNGVFAVINAQIANVATNDLLAAAQLFEIPQTSNLSVILDAIMAVIIAVVAAIPDEGPVIAAVLTVAWSAAKLGEGGPEGSSIEATVAELAGKLTNYLQAMVTATATQLSTINSNWGKLHEFASQAIQKKLRLDQFGMEPPAQPGDRPEVSQGYITAAAKAWSIIIYQALFAIPEGDSPGNPSHRAFQYGHLSGSPPDNPWNPDGGNYQFVYYLPCTYKDNCGNPTSGYIGYTCASNAPAPVLQALFGPNSSIDLNPLEFFMGFNGWPPVVDYTTLTNELITVG